MLYTTSNNNNKGQSSWDRFLSRPWRKQKNKMWNVPCLVRNSLNLLELTTGMLYKILRERFISSFVLFFRKVVWDTTFSSHAIIIKLKQTRTIIQASRSVDHLAEVMGAHKKPSAFHHITCTCFWNNCYPWTKVGTPSLFFHMYWRHSSPWPSPLSPAKDSIAGVIVMWLHSSFWPHLRSRTWGLKSQRK